MNPPIFLAGLGAGLIAADHLTRGRKQYLMPMLQASFDDLAKKTLLCVYLYLSFFFILSAAVLLAVGAGYDFNAHAVWLVKFISVNFALFTVIQIVIAATSDIPNAIRKMYQWTLFAFVAVFAWVGVVYAG
jgi:hypothetical protein